MVSDEEVRPIRFWHQIPHEDRIGALETALREVLEPSTDPESGYVKDKPGWWDDFWNGFFLGARFKKHLIDEARLATDALETNKGVL